MNKIIVVGQMYPNSGNPQAGRIYDPEGISPSLDTCGGGNRMPKIVEYSNSTKENNMEEIILKAVNAYPDDTCRTIKANYAKTSKANFESKGTWGGTGVMTNMRIRKLTPKECWRLMGFPDEAFEKAAEVNSNAQLYKEAGNSIVVNVLEQIIGKLGERYEEFRAE